MAKLRCLPPAPIEDFETALRARVRKLVRKGETRKAIVALREACLRDEHAAALWTMYGALLADAGRADDARQAFRHAVWVRRSSGDDARARTTQALLDRLDGSVAA